MRTLKSFFIACVKLYRYTLSPLFFSLGVQCRFSPSCSQYALEALEKHGPVRGSLLSAGRVLRCHPLCAGGHDPVPPVSTTIGMHHG